MPNSSIGGSAGSSDTALHRRTGVLTVTAPPEEAGRSVAIDPQGTAVGRDAACDLIFASDRVSRRHALVRVRDGEYVVEDLGSKNGTLLNGDRVIAARPLHDGDLLAFADVEIEFGLAGPATSPRRSQSPAAAAWQPDHPTEASDTARDRPDRQPRPSLRRDLQQAPGFSLPGLLLAVVGSAVGTVFTSAAGTGPWGTLAGAAVLPVVSAAFSTKRAGEKGRVRTAAVVLLSLAALIITWAGVSVADLAAGRSVVPGAAERPSTFPGLAANGSPPPTQQTEPAGSVPLVEVSPVDCGTLAVGATADCRTLLVKYNGTGRLHITRAQVTGENPGDFTAGEECVGRWLRPGQTCQLSVTFQPSAAGQRNATLVIQQNLPSPDTGTRAALVGTGATPADTCRDGFVWREAVPGDHVCVPPETRLQAQNDNALATSRRVG